MVAYTEDRTLSVSEFQRYVGGVARNLQARPEQRWALICADTLWFAVGFLALLETHKTVILPQAAGAANVREAQADAVLTDQPTRFTGLHVQDVMNLKVNEARGDTILDDESRIEFYTSGSTGAPKRVDKRLRQLRAEVKALEAQWGAALDDAIVLASVPHHHLYGLLFRVLWPLWMGRAFYAPTCAQPYDFHAVAQRFGRCAIVSSPALLIRVVDFNELQLQDTCVALFSSGAPLPETTAAKIATELGRAVVEVYGSTETGGIAWRSWDVGMGQRPWRVLPAVETAIEGSGEGILRVRSPWTWQETWVDTGDLAQSLDEHRFLLRGRADGVLKVEDKRVSLAEMERRLRMHAFVQTARVLPLAGRRAQLGAVVVLSDTGQNTLKRNGKSGMRKILTAHLRNWYEPVLIPRKWRFVHVLPDNEMGKIEREKLLALFAEHS